MKVMAVSPSPNLTRGKGTDRVACATFTLMPCGTPPGRVPHGKVRTERLIVQSVTLFKTAVPPATNADIANWLRTVA
ncbi:MAG: hypothetical protein RL695_1897 [Pseudomonadota bacterium]|jgi:hypothetical protein